MKISAVFVSQSRQNVGEGYGVAADIDLHGFVKKMSLTKTLKVFVEHR